MVAALSGTVSGTFVGVIAQQGTPSADYQGYLWLKLDVNNDPLWFEYWSTNSGKWLPTKDTEVFFGTMSLTGANTYLAAIANFPYSDATQSIYVLQAPTGGTNGGASTLQLPVGAAKPIQIGATALASGQILEKNWYIFSYDGTAFQLMNPFVKTAFSSSFTTSPQSIGAPGARIAIPHGLNGTPNWIAYWVPISGFVGSYGAGVTAGQRFGLENIVASYQNGSNITYNPAATVNTDATNINVYWAYNTSAPTATEVFIRTDNASGNASGGMYPLYQYAYPGPASPNNLSDFQLVVVAWL